jgi:hypothetical protein
MVAMVWIKMAVAVVKTTFDGIARAAAVAAMPAPAAEEVAETVSVVLERAAAVETAVVAVEMVAVAVVDTTGAAAAATVR